MELYLLLAILILTIAILVLALAYYPLAVRLYRMKKSEAEEKDRTAAQVAQILDEARAMAQKIAQETGERFSQNLAKVVALTEESKQMLAGELEKISLKRQSELDRLSTKFLEEYQGLLEGRLSEDIKVLTNITVRINSQADQYLESFRQQLASEATAVTSQLQQKLAEQENTALKIAQKEIEDYKRYQMSQIAASALEKINLVSQEVIAKALSSSDHKELIMESLEKFAGTVQDAKA